MARVVKNQNVGNNPPPPISSPCPTTYHPQPYKQGCVGLRLLLSRFPEVVLGYSRLLYLYAATPSSPLHLCD